MNRALPALALVAFVATGCASRGDVRRLQDDVAALRANVTELHHFQELSSRELARVVGELRALDIRNTELQAALSEHGAEAARLRARLDTAEQALREAQAPSRSQAPVTAPAPSAAAPAPAAPGAPPARPDTRRPDEAEQEYNAALALFRAREHGQAVLDLLDFIAKHPRHRLAPSAQYWIGEAYYLQRDYRQALLEFQRVIEMAPTSPKAADALLRIGLSYTNLRDDTRALQAWQRVVQEYPATESAARARALLRAHAARRP
jgi:tol-pal system protein YbgF